MTTTARATQSPHAAQTLTVPARTRRGALAKSAQQSDQPANAAAEANATDVANFAHIISLLRTPALNVGVRAEGGGAGVASRTGTRARGTNDAGDREGSSVASAQSPVVAQAVIDVANIAAQELKTPAQKSELAQPADAPARVVQSESLKKNAPDTDGGANSEHHDGHGNQPSQQQPQSQAMPANSVNPAAGGGQSAADGPHENAATPQPLGATGSTRSMGNASTTPAGAAASGQPAAATARSVSTHSDTSATTGISTARATANKNFLSRLTNAAAPAKAQVQQKQVTDVASRALATALKKGGGEVTMRLRPEGLGQLKVHMQVEDAKVWATLSPQTGAARDLLTDSLPHLRAALEAQGLTVERMTVESPPGDATTQFHAGGAPHKGMQDASLPQTGAEPPQHQVTPDGSGASSQDSSGSRSGPNDSKPGGAGSTTRTDAIADAAPDSPWAFATGAVTSGAMEWVG